MAAVDVEDESILASIFKDSFPENWREKPDFAAYLSQLSSCGVDELNREPERLAEERAQILQQTRELAFTNYKTFIRTADCTRHIYTDFSTVENCLSKLLHKLPSFTERCRSVLHSLCAENNGRTVQLIEDLRLCCPIGLAQEVSRCVEEALIKVTKLILVFHRAEESAFSSRERELFVQFCSAFAEDMVPFLNRCLQVLFPPAQLALILGVPPTQVYKYGSLGCINVNAVLEPLEFVLPQKEPEPVTSVLELCTDLSSLTTAESDPSPALKPITPQEEKPVLSEQQEPVSASDPRLSQKENISAESVSTEQNNPILEPEMTFDVQDLTGPDDLSTTDVNVEEMLSK
ncbi:conserved oligomeric Golgi complex subunit 8-like [Sinocyclocheilus rhinocerous]|uniref:conserved oligomeric Golgi complex subunit 8-like n=1 Tax=Sinocyclocheilus rhinocerous TaxID=307959 RepID=UPI0007B86F15|nr:PREDICTED: conserved oligomeric Golgi complex subunit 8-like [Sinocyclocheilus rhinocerous]